MKKNKFPLIFIIVLVIVAILAFFQYAQAQFGEARSGNPGNPPALPNTSLPASEGDAIGVRIIPNPSHYSIYRWYESQGFQGSPQALIVDGYEAIRDGRTVYVNAANVDQNTKSIYTNIYLISYNQNPTTKTVDILGQIVSHWKFNNNIIENVSPQPNCAISAINCATDQDCGPDQYCATSTSAIGSCVLKNSKNCLTDNDCPTNFFCNSLKAKIIRDIKRVGKIEELKEALFNFKKINNRYPLLSSGSYLAGNTISLWPSWSQVFLSDLTVIKNFFDPINRLGFCPGYDLETCWNKDTKSFVYNPTPGYLMLPANSYALVYSTDTAGSDYNLCAVMESREPALNYHFSPNDPISSTCVTATGIISGGQATNTAPVLIDKSLTGEAGMEFNGFVKVIDAEGNPLTWTLNTSGTNWATWKNNNLLGQAPILQNTNNLNQKKIYAQKAGNPGEYNTTLTVSDGQGAILSTSTKIKIINPAPFIEAQDGEFILDPTIPFIYNFNFSDNNITTPNTAYTVTKIIGPFDLLNGIGLTKTVSSIGISKYKVNYQGIIPTSRKFTVDTNFVYRVQVNDEYSASSTKQFTIRIIAEKPQLNFNCQSFARLNQTYSCLIGGTNQNNHSLVYSSNSLPAGLRLEINAQNQGTNTPLNVGLQEDSSWFKRLWQVLVGSVYNTESALGAAATNNEIKSTSTSSTTTGGPNLNVYLKGQPTSISEGAQISIQATNEYGTFSTRDFILKINNYCGDGQAQTPNTENRGGIYNDGFEDCDGGSKITSIPSQSSISVQYGCSTEPGEKTPNPIPNNNYCVFKSPLDGGGFRGDGYCQAIRVASNGATSTLETTTNSPEDCGTPAANCVPSCTNKDCGDDGCGGSCGACQSVGQTCINNKCVSSCVRDCSNKICGDDGCGGSCGSCNNNKQCVNGQCVNPSCGNGNCQAEAGENCNTCPADCGCIMGQICTTNGLCCTFSAASCQCGVVQSLYTKCGGACCNSNEVCCNGGTCTNNSNGQYLECGNNCCSSTSQRCCDGNVCRPKNLPCPNTQY